MKSQGQSPSDSLRDQDIFHSTSRLESLYTHSHIPNNGPGTAVAYDAITAVAANVDSAVALELIASEEDA